MEKIDYRKMGMEIKIRRLRADISQSDLAKQIGVSQSHLCNCLLYTSPSPRDA